jgi:hypothetical protein
MQTGQCGNQLGTKFQEVVCDEHGIGGGGMSLLRAELMDLKPGVIGAVALSLRLANSSARETW